MIKFVHEAMEDMEDMDVYGSNTIVIAIFEVMWHITREIRPILLEIFSLCGLCEI